jgi:ATP-dependent RNA helicase RhlE
MSFNTLGLIEELLKAVRQKGYETPSPIQKKVIPVILEGKDVLASAQTGTGKTAGFTLPMLQILSQGQQMRQRPIRALVLTPTRELAAQVFDNVKSYGRFLDLKSAVVFGGVKQNPQAVTLRQGVDVLVATPGRLLDLHNQKILSLAKVEILVLDEADRMLDMGFLRDIKKIISFLPAKRQNLLFSATFSKEIRQLAGSILNNPIPIEATPENSTVEKINQKAYRVEKDQKSAFLIQLIKEGNWKQVLVFTRTKHGANKLCKSLLSKDISSLAIHGNKSQQARTKALEGFKNGSIRILVATDIAARGLDIPLLPHVINYELPNVPEDYVHRIGRTGRAGASGEAISLVGGEEMAYLRDIEKLTDQKIPFDKFEGFQATPPMKEEVRKQEPRTEKQQNNQTRLIPRSERTRKEQPKREGNQESQKRFRPKWPKNR